MLLLLDIFGLIFHYYYCLSSRMATFINNSNNNSQQHRYVSHFNHLTNDDKKELSTIFNDFDSEISHLNNKRVIIGQKLQRVNDIIQSKKGGNNVSRPYFVDSNGNNKLLSFSNFMKDKYIGIEKNKFDNLDQIYNLMKTAKNAAKRKESNVCLCFFIFICFYTIYRQIWNFLVKSHQQILDLCDYDSFSIVFCL